MEVSFNVALNDVNFVQYNIALHVSIWLAGIQHPTDRCLKN